MNDTNENYGKNTLLFYFMIIIGLIFAFPFVWMLIATTNTSYDIVSGRLLPGTYIIENLKVLFGNRSVALIFWNSLRNSLLGTFFSLFVCSMAGYGFTIYRDKAKDRLMFILLLSMMVPFAAVMIPLFRLFTQFNLMNTTLGFILPFISTAFLIFFFRQSTISFPMEIVQAARIDGMGEFGIYLRIFVPIMMPTFAAAGIVTFMNYWNNFIWPLIILQNYNAMVLSRMISMIQDTYTIDYGELMTGVLIYTLPVVIVFITQQKRFISGIIGSVKG